MRSLLIATLMTISCAGTALAQDYPTRPVHILNGFAAGGPGDLLLRIIAEPLGERLGQQIVVESRPGASGAIAGQALAAAEPDGHTLGIFFAGHAVSEALRPSIPYRLLDDFQPVSTIAFYALVLATKGGTEIKSVADLVAAAKERPGQLSYGSSGNGTTSHLAGELFQSAAGIKLRHVQYTGDAASLQDVMRGDITISFATTTLAGARIRDGSVRGLGLTALEPWDGLPDVPTVAATVPDFEILSWAGIMGPKGMPAELVDRLNKELNAVLGDPSIIARIEEIVGGTVRPGTPEDMSSLIASDVARWQKLAADVGIKIE